MMSDFDRQMRMAATEDRQIRLAAESVVNASLASASQGFTPRTPDAFNDVLLAGMRYNGRMSNVRRFFCLFITFDLLFTILMWLICIVLSGSNVKEAFTKEIVHYHIKTSLFDVVGAAALRFTILLLFYALCHMDHWCTVVLSTSLTSAFLIAKVFLYDWTQSKQPVFEVLLILTSFVLVWSEIWFLDIKVIPQEALVREWFLGYSDSERAPLLSQNLVSPAIATENIASFYTPMDSPDHSDHEENRASRKSSSSSFSISPDSIKLTQDKIDECKKTAATLSKRSYDLITSDDWKAVSVTPENDVISYLILPKPDGKVFKITGKIDMAAEKLINYLHDTLEDSPSWNKQVTDSRVLYNLDENTGLAYQATDKIGTISARDFVILRHRGQHGSYYINSGISISFNVLPARKNFVRGENGVSCMAARDLASGEKDKCEFVWVLNTNLKGWVPQRLTDLFLPFGLQEFMASLRNLVRSLKE